MLSTTLFLMIVGSPIINDYFIGKVTTITGHLILGNATSISKWSILQDQAGSKSNVENIW